MAAKVMGGRGDGDAAVNVIFAAAREGGAVDGGSCGRELLMMTIGNGY